MLELTILVVTAYWLLSFFGRSVMPSLPHSGGFIYLLAVFIVILISLKFLSQA